jgi:hypothetical protein
MKDLSIREATPADGDAVAAVNVASWQQGYRGLLPEEMLAGLSVAELGSAQPASHSTSSASAEQCPANDQAACAAVYRRGCRGLSLP